MAMRKKILIIFILAFMLLAAAAGVSAWYGATELTVVSYEVPADVSESIRIVHLTDLHSCVYGEDNAPLVELVAAQEPDLIFMTGDMLTDTDEGPEVVCALIPKLAQIAPVYYGYGNHEKAWEERTGEKMEPLLTAAGAIVLDCTYLDVEVNGQQLRIGGYHGYWRQPHMYRVPQEQKAAELAFCEDFENTDRVKLLLCHIPTAWLDWGYIDKFPVDVVFSGHYHGGQIRLPLIGGLYAPYVGALPEYTEGVFEGTQATCVLSTGVGTEKGIPRIHNLPQILVVDIIPK